MGRREAMRAGSTIDRREFLGKCARGAAGAALAGAFGRRAFAQPRSKPNIIFIMADDLGWGDLSCFGQTRFTTPNIDAMASGGTTFTDFYSGSTVCAPTRCVLMTGYHTGHARVRDNSASDGSRVPLLDEDVTVAEVLKPGGYATGAFGKWGLGEAGSSGAPNLQGFDEWFGYLNQSRAHFYYTDYLYKNMEQYPTSTRDYSHDLIFGQAMEFVRRNRDRPFFLYLAITIPHASVEVPKDSLAEEIGSRPDKASWQSHYNDSPAARAAFVAMVRRMDRDVGRLLAYLAELGIDDDTIVLFTSDNGPHREGGADPDFFRSAGPLRGIKRDLYEGGIRVPMIVRWPGHVAEGAVKAEPWAMWDFLPTAAELADLTPPAGLDGVSFVPAITGRTQQPHEYLYWEWPNNDILRQAVRKGRWKAVRLGAAAATELYDLETDLGETTNVASDHPDVVAEVESIMVTARTPSPLWI